MIDAPTRWARQQAVVHELSDREAHALLLLATIGNQRGEGFSTRGDLAAFLRCSDDHTTRLLKQLRDRGLVIRIGSPNGRLRWRLHDARQPAAQLSLEDAESDTQRSDSGMPAGVPHVGPVRHPEVGPVRHPEVGHKDKKTKKDEEQEKRGRAHDQHLDWGSLQPTLRQVLEVLEAAPDLVVVDAAVNSALAGHPQPPYDHLRAAHTVAAWAHERTLNVGLASLLLNRAFDRQHRGGPQHRAGGRRPAGDDPAAAARLEEMRLTLAAARGERTEETAA